MREHSLHGLRPGEESVGRFEGREGVGEGEGRGEEGEEACYKCCRKGILY